MPLRIQAVLDFIADNPGASRGLIRSRVAPEVSETTVWHALKQLIDEGRIEASGQTRSTGYSRPPAIASLVRTLCVHIYGHHTISVRSCSTEGNLLIDTSPTRAFILMRQTGETYV